MDIATPDAVTGVMAVAAEVAAADVAPSAAMDVPEGDHSAEGVTGTERASDGSFGDGRVQSSLDSWLL